MKYQWRRAFRTSMIITLRLEGHRLFPSLVLQRATCTRKEALSEAHPTKEATRCQDVWRCCSRRISYKLEHWPCESNRACHAQEGEKGKLENSLNVKLRLTPFLPLDHALFLVVITHLPLFNCHFSSQRTWHSHWFQTEPLFTTHIGNAFNSQNSSLHSSEWSLPGGKQGKGCLFSVSSEFTAFQTVQERLWCLPCFPSWSAKWWLEVFL